MVATLFGPPEKLRIPADGPIEYVGRLEDGSQYMAFISGAFPDDYLMSENWRQIKQWVGVIHLFDVDGNHLCSHSALGGYDIEGWEAACEKAWGEVHRMFTPYRSRQPRRCDINVKLFSAVLNGVTHGLIYEALQDEDGRPRFELVMLEPRDVAFHPPWDCGQWST